MKSSCRFGPIVTLTIIALAPLSAQKQADPTAPLSLKAPERSVVCGTTILSGNAALDSTIAKSPPPGNFTLRVIQPKTCSTNNASAANGARYPKAVHPGDLPNRLPTFLGPTR